MSELIDVAGLRLHVNTGLTDEALQDIIDYNEEAIGLRVGTVPERKVLLFPPAESTTIIQLGTPAEIASITEWHDIEGYSTVLDETDYFNTKGTLRRRGDGNHPYTYWNAPVQIKFVGAVDLASRKMVLVGLCKLDINHNPGLASFTVGQHTEDYSAGVAQRGYVEEREALLGQLTNPETPPVFA